MFGWDNTATSPLELFSDWLDSNDNWIIILDNADDKGVFFGPRPMAISAKEQGGGVAMPLVTYLPQATHGGRILITSRNRDAAFRLTDRMENFIDVPEMSEDESIHLLSSRLPNDTSDRAEKSCLVELLGYLPLTITQAASHISVRRSRMSVRRYSNHIRENNILLLENMGDLRRDPTVPSSVLLTWQMSFDQIKQENSSAAELLSLMSVLDRQGIPQSLLQMADEGEVKFDKRLAPLVEFSLITSVESGQDFQMHRLIQTAVREWLERDEQLGLWQQNVVRTLADRLPPADFEERRAWDHLLPHIQLALDYSFQDPDVRLLQATISHDSGEHLICCQRYALAKIRCQYALDIRQEILGEEDVYTAEALYTIGILRSLIPAYYPFSSEKSEQMMRKALQIHERVEGNDSAQTWMTRQVLATTLLASNDNDKIEEARKLYIGVIEAMRVLKPGDFDRRLVSKNGLAVAYAKQHNLCQAESIFREILHYNLDTLGKEDERTMTVMHNLAVPLNQTGNYEESKKLGRRVLSMQTKVLGEDHPETYEAMGRFSGILAHQGKFHEAEILCRLALDSCKTRFGNDEHAATRLIKCLIALLEDQHRYDEAEGLRRQQIDTFTQHLGIEDSLVIAWKSDLANVLYDHGQHEKAWATLREVVWAQPRSIVFERRDRCFVNFVKTLILFGTDEDARVFLLDERTHVHRKLPETIDSTTNLATDLQDAN